MNKKIKKILENMKEWSVDGNLYFEINDTEAKLLYDYITNLQEENERLRKDYGRLLQDNAYTLELEQKIDKATEIYKNRNTCKYKKEKFMKDKSTSDLMYEALQGSDKE